jgi:hypothetical protein
MHYDDSVPSIWHYYFTFSSLDFSRVHIIANGRTHALSDRNNNDIVDQLNDTSRLVK